MKMKSLLLGIALLFVCSTGICATHTEAEYKVAYKLFDIVKMKDILDKSLEDMVKLQEKNIPMLSQYRTVLLDFTRKYINYEAVKQPLADIHLDIFTVDELNELCTFYQTPLGAKMYANQNLMFQRCTELSMQLLRPHMSELLAMIQAQKQEAPEITPEE